MDEPPLKVLIADDEPLAAERLQLLLQAVSSGGGLRRVTSTTGHSGIRCVWLANRSASRPAV